MFSERMEKGCPVQVAGQPFSFLSVYLNRIVALISQACSFR